MAVRKNLRRQDKDAEQEHRTVQERSVSQERSALGEGIGVLCVTLTIFLGLAFFSYQPEAADSNQVGRAGHLVAHVLCRAFGLTVYLFPALLLYAMALRFHWLRCAAPFVQGISFVVFTLAASAFLALRFDGQPVFQAGGWVGSFLALHLRQAGNLVGAYLLLSPVLLVSFMGITQLSLVKLGSGLATGGRALGRFGWSRLRALSGQVAGQISSRLEQVTTRWAARRTERQTPPSEPVFCGGEEAEVYTLKKEAPPSRPLPKKKRRQPAPESEPLDALDEPEESKPPIIISRPPAATDEDKPAPPAQPPSPTGGADNRPYTLPPLALLDPPVRLAVKVDEEALHASSQILENKLSDFGVSGSVVAVRPGPVITTYEFEPAPGVKVNRVVSLADDLQMALRAVSVRILAPIPGKAVVGIEVSNSKREKVCLREILDSGACHQTESPLALALGKDTVGNPVVTDLARMPHLLVAGATGTGKSVSLNVMIMSILARATPRDVRFIMIDPKMLELSLYEGLPHQLSHVITNPKEAGVALQEVVRRMEYRYKLLKDKGVRNIAAYNRALETGETDTDGVIKLTEVVHDDEDELTSAQSQSKPQLELNHQRLPYLIVLVDELADLMLTVGREIEEPITRLAQMGRAAGIHLILATQRPSVDVITGLIKANFPARVSFQVSSRIDSRTILDAMGAERLLGDGDMLFLPPGSAKPQRIHGAFVSEPEIRKFAVAIKKQGKPVFDEELVTALESARTQKGAGPHEEEDYDEMYEQARDLVMESRQASISWLQRRLRVGYNRAARMIERMEREGLIAPAGEAGKPREVLVPAQAEAE